MKKRINITKIFWYKRFFVIAAVVVCLLFLQILGQDSKHVRQNNTIGSTWSNPFTAAKKWFKKTFKPKKNTSSLIAPTEDDDILSNVSNAAGQLGQILEDHPFETIGTGVGTFAGGMTGLGMSVPVSVAEGATCGPGVLFCAAAAETVNGPAMTLGGAAVGGGIGNRGGHALDEIVVGPMRHTKRTKTIHPTYDDDDDAPNKRNLRATSNRYIPTHRRTRRVGKT